MLQKIVTFFKKLFGGKCDECNSCCEKKEKKKDGDTAKDIYPMW